MRFLLGRLSDLSLMFIWCPLLFKGWVSLTPCNNSVSNSPACDPRCSDSSSFSFLLPMLMLDLDLSRGAAEACLDILSGRIIDLTGELGRLETTSLDSVCIPVRCLSDNS